MNQNCCRAWPFGTKNALTAAHPHKLDVLLIKPLLRANPPHCRHGHKKRRFFFLSTAQSLTTNSADQWLGFRPFACYVVAAEESTQTT